MDRLSKGVGWIIQGAGYDNLGVAKGLVTRIVLTH